MDSLKIKTPLNTKVVEGLVIGQKVLISGVIFTARDQAHKRIYDIIKNGKKLPFNLTNEVIYYVGPTPAPENRVIGSAGPTTSGRMDAYAPLLIEAGLRGMIGKGTRSEAVIESMKLNKSVYFAAIGGAGALISDCIIESKVIAFEDLGTEAVHRLVVKDLPTIVAIDSKGNNLYEEGIDNYFKKRF